MGAYSGDRHDKYNMNTFRLAAIAALLLSGPAFGYDDSELEAPDADVYVAAQILRTDFSDLNGADEYGFRARLGLQLNDARVFDRWRWRLEGGLTQLGEGASRSREVLTSGFAFPKDTETRITDTNTRVTGFEIGLRLYDNELFSVRAGGMLYSVKTKTNTRVTETYSDMTPDFTFERNSSDSASGIAPYIGAAIEFPVIDASTKLVLEYDFMRLEQADLHSIGAGIQFTF